MSETPRVVPQPKLLKPLGGATPHGRPSFTSSTDAIDAAQATRVYEALGSPSSGGRLPVTLTDTPPAEPPGSPLFHREGYILEISGGSAELYAETRRGYVRGIATLAQLASLGGRGDVLIVDYPSFPYRGVVEGFYFEPWTWSDRRSIVRFQAYMRMNTYIYAPKDDPYHREKWRIQYPQETLSQLQGLAALSSLLEVDLVFAVSPGLSAVYSSGDDEDVLVEKYLSVAELGVKSFGLFYDDIPEELLHEEDRRRYSSLAEAHADFANRVYRRLTEELGSADLIVVPTEYRGVDMGPYFRELGRLLDTRVKLMWTGPKVCSTEITLEQASRVAELSRGRLLVWDNYPVNDYARNRLNLGPLRGRDPRLPEALEGFLYNPMNEAWASRIPLATGADYAWNPQAYSPDDSLQAALALLYGDAAGHVELLASMLGGSTLWPATPRSADEALSAAKTGDYGPAESLLAGLEALPDAILSADPKLYGEAEPYLYRLHLEARAGLDFLSALRARGPGEAWALLARGLELWRAARSLPHIAGMASRHVEEVWYTFIERDFLGELLYTLASRAAAAVHGSLQLPWIFSNTDHLEGHDWSRAVDGDQDTWYLSRRSYMPPGARLQVAFPAKRRLTVELRQALPGGSPEPASLALRADGAECSPPCATEASTILVSATAPSRGRRALQLALQPATPLVYSDIPSSTSPSNIVDGRPDTYLAVPPGSRGRSAVIDLAGKRRVERILVLQAPGAAASLRVYVAAPRTVYPLLHLDAVEWIPVGRARGHYTAIPVSAETGYVKLEVEGAGGGRIHQVIVE